ncbi:MAG: sugar ABC transporter permease, partial [Bradyrhizobium guangdongense]
LGYGSAIAVIFFLLIVALAALMLYARQRMLWTEIASGA